MRAIILTLFFYLIIGTILTISFMDYSLLGLFLLVLGMALVSWLYADKAILFFLGAREVTGGDQPQFYNAALQEAYKLGVPLPKTYIYEGNFERGFVLQNKKNVSLIISRSFLKKVKDFELSGMCFALLLQVKNRQARKRTRVLYLVGGVSWLVNSVCSFTSGFIPFKEIRNSIEWIFTYFLYPFLEIIFRLTLGESYFRVLDEDLAKYPDDYRALKLAVLKFNKPDEIYSLASKKTLQFHIATKTTNLKNILALELLPHEWDSF